MYSVIVNINAVVNNGGVVGSINVSVIGLRGCRNFSTSLTTNFSLLFDSIFNVPMSAARTGAASVVNINTMQHVDTVGFNIIGRVILA